MNCPNCRALAPDGADNCPSCGSTLPVECGSCGAANERANNFCFRCGSRLLEPERLPESPAPAPAVPAAVCPRCHQSNEPGAAYCYSCGLPLSPGGRLPGAIMSDRPDAPAFSIGRPAGFWIRLAAFLVDVLLVVAVFLAAWPLLSGQTFTEVSESFLYSEEPITIEDLASIVLNIAYFTVAVALWATTIGKRVFRMYVVRSDGSKVGPGRALARYFASQLSMLIFGVGFVMIGVRRDKRGLHDLICDTVVIIRQR